MHFLHFCQQHTHTHTAIIHAKITFTSTHTYTHIQTNTSHYENIIQTQNKLTLVNVKKETLYNSNNNSNNFFFIFYLKLKHEFIIFVIWERVNKANSTTKPTTQQQCHKNHITMEILSTRVKLFPL